MRSRALIAAGFLLGFAVFPAYGQPRIFEIEAACGGWTLAPFHPILESRTETAVREAFQNAASSTFLDDVLSPPAAKADFGDSSGFAFSATLWMRLGSSRFSVGLRADAFSFRLPFTFDAHESVSYAGYSIVEIDGRSVGAARVRGLSGTLLGRWTAVRSRAFELDFHIGLSLIPYEGTIDQELEGVVRTPLGDLTLSGGYDMTIAEARTWSDGRIPRAILSPAAAVEGRFKLWPNGGIALGFTVSQGTFISGGLYFAL
jgi:hypothetical protein